MIKPDFLLVFQCHFRQSADENMFMKEEDVLYSY